MLLIYNKESATFDGNYKQNQLQSEENYQENKESDKNSIEIIWNSNGFRRWVTDERSTSIHYDWERWIIIYDSSK